MASPSERPPPPPSSTDDLVVLVRFRVRHLLGRPYPKLEAELPKLSREALQELARFVGDAADEIDRAKKF